VYKREICSEFIYNNGYLRIEGVTR
jgi:hypothetical protein